jgi:type IV secretory pathway TraG/TraD family ATPase VirD4
MAAGAGSHDGKNEVFYWFLALTVGVLPWAFAVPHTFSIPKGQILKGYYYSLLATPKTPFLLFALIFGAVMAAVIVFFLSRYNRTNFEGARYHQKLRGSEMVSSMKLKQANRERGVSQLRLCGVPVPKSCENLHFLFTGSTGSGKTVAISELIESAQERESDRILCVDPNGGFLRHFYQEGDVILNPFDARGTGWSIFNEIRTKFDCEQFAVAMIPKAPATEQESWNSMARVLVSETMIKIWENATHDTDTNGELFYYLINAPTEELYSFLKGTPAQGLFEATETFSSIKAVLTQYIKPHKYLKHGGFSIRKFLESNEGNLWITWREDQLAALKPLISCWVDVICAAILSMPDITEQERTRKTLAPFLLVLDEMDSLEKLNYIVQALTKGRKHRLSVVGGVQSLAQLDETYGKNEALTLRNSFSNNAVCQVASGDTYSAEQYSKIFGYHEITRYQHSISLGSGGGKGTRSLQKETEPLIMPSQISGLNPLEFYFKFAQSNLVCKTKLPYLNRDFITDGFVLAKNEWTRQKVEA